MKSEHNLTQPRRCDMTDSKPCSTPVPAKSNLSTLDGAPLSNPTEFRQVIGALQYLTLTRPGLIYPLL